MNDKNKIIIKLIPHIFKVSVLCVIFFKLLLFLIVSSMALQSNVVSQEGVTQVFIALGITIYLSIEIPRLLNDLKIKSKNYKKQYKL